MWLTHEFLKTLAGSEKAHFSVKFSKNKPKLIAVYVMD